MSTYFTVWHYLVVTFSTLLFFAGIVFAFIQKDKKMIAPIIFITLLVVSLITSISLVAIDGYTKHAKVFDVENHRVLLLEKIVYTGYVKNTGDYTIGKVALTIKLINKGHATLGKANEGSFFQTRSITEFFSGGANVLYRPQTVEKTFNIATDLKPNEIQQFRVSFDFPPYFEQVTDNTTLSAH